MDLKRRSTHGALPSIRLENELHRPKYVLRCMPAITVNGGSVDWNMHVLTLKARVVERFELMCMAICEDIQNPDGSGQDFLGAIRKVESGEADRIPASGNAWSTHLTRNEVNFEGHYSQGEGGEVSLAQYKLAVETYIRFLRDPERKPVEVVFPES